MIEYACRVIELESHFQKNKVGFHISYQIMRSATSVAANYAEALGAESRSDFIHKMKLCLKELRECRVWLKISLKSKITGSLVLFETLIQETDALIAIIFTSIRTARSHMSQSK